MVLVHVHSFQFQRFPVQKESTVGIELDIADANCSHICVYRFPVQKHFGAYLIQIRVVHSPQSRIVYAHLSDYLLRFLGLQLFFKNKGFTYRGTCKHNAVWMCILRTALLKGHQNPAHPVCNQSGGKPRNGVGFVHRRGNSAADALPQRRVAGVATRADGLSVKVKVNEAEMTLTQVENGLSLSKMLLCQLCGLPLESDIQLTDENMDNLTLPSTYTESNVNTALANREELKSLELAQKIYQQKVNVVRSEFLPTVAFTANYLVTNPSLYNGFENKFRGMWAAGIMVKIPVFHWGEGLYKVKAAKAEANIARYQLEDVKEKVELQVTQSSYKVNEATKKLAMAQKNMEKADENLRYANLGFKEGVIPTSNVLEAQTAWLSAQSGKIDAQIDLKMSEIYLNKSMGTLK